MAELQGTCDRPTAHCAPALLEPTAPAAGPRPAPATAAATPYLGAKISTSLLYKMEMDFGDLQIIGLSRIFIQIIGLSLFSPDYRISTREY